MVTGQDGADSEKEGATGEELAEGGVSGTVKGTIAAIVLLIACVGAFVGAGILYKEQTNELLMQFSDFLEGYERAGYVLFVLAYARLEHTTSWMDQLGRHSPHFGVDTEVVMPLPKPVGYTESESYKVSFQFGREKYLTPWLLIIGRKQVPMLEVTLRHSGGDLEGVTAKIVPMPEKYLQEHESIRQKFVDPADWPKHILVQYTWVEKSEIDVVGGLYVLFFAGNILFIITALYILQTSKDKLSRFLNENVVQPSMVGEVPKAD